MHAYNFYIFDTLGVGLGFYMKLENACKKLHSTFALFSCQTGLFLTMERDFTHVPEI